MDFLEIFLNGALGMYVIDLLALRVRLKYLKGKVNSFPSIRLIILITYFDAILFPFQC